MVGPIAAQVVASTCVVRNDACALHFVSVFSQFCSLDVCDIIWLRTLCPQHSQNICIPYLHPSAFRSLFPLLVYAHAPRQQQTVCIGVLAKRVSQLHTRFDQLGCGLHGTRSLCDRVRHGKKPGSDEVQRPQGLSFFKRSTTVAAIAGFVS